MGTPQTPASILQLGPFQLHVGTRVLLRDGHPVQLAPRAVEVLVVLATRANEIVSKDDLMKAVWPDTFVEEVNLAVYISALRKLFAAEDDAFQIETIPKRGYRLKGRVTAAAAGDDSPAKAVSDKAPLIPPHASRYALKVAGVLLALAVAAGAVWLIRSVHEGRSAGAATNPQPARAQAEALYLQGRYYWNRRTAADLNRAVDYFTQAIVHDPSYAPAYVGLADCYNLLREYGTMPDKEAFPRALAAAKKAVELDDTSSDAHASLAFASFYGAWDVETADREFSRAIELAPENARAHHWRATFLMTAGRSAEAVAEIKRAQQLDPTSPAILADRGLILFYAGHSNQALSLLRRLEQDDPSFMSPHRYLAFIALAKADYPRYLAESRQMAALAKDEPGLALIRVQEQGWQRGGTKGMLESVRRQRQEDFEKGSQPAYPLAQAFAMLGERQEALRYLQIAYQQHEVSFLTIRIDPTLSALHSEPAYQELVERVFSKS